MQKLVRQPVHQKILRKATLRKKQMNIRRLMRSKAGLDNVRHTQTIRKRKCHNFGETR